MSLRLSISLTEGDTDLVYTGMDTVADPSWLRQRILAWMGEVATADEDVRRAERDKAAKAEASVAELRRVEQERTE
jgi:hypothetical protein